MNDIERKFLLLVERGDSGNLEELLNSENNLDINCCDPLGRNALVIAIANENIEIIKILIKAGVEMGDSLLYAIDENLVEAVELLLEHEERICARRGGLHSWEYSREDSYFSADMTPLILAAHRNNFEIIRILVDRRISPIAHPHDTRCDCNTCCLNRANDCLKHSRARINAYKALASPCLMALTHQDPLLAAFQMSAKLENLAHLEPEYKQDYLKLRGQCQAFATKLLDYTRTSKELEVLLNYSDEYTQNYRAIGESHELGAWPSGSVDSSQFSNSTVSTGVDMDSRLSNYSFANQIANPDSETRCSKFLKNMNRDSILSVDSVTGKHESYRSHMRLARLRLAIHCKQKTFCAHPNIQELLATMWYENLPGFRRKSIFAQIFQVLFIGFMFPVYSIAYLVAPHTRLGGYIKKPVIKFICHSASYITFLIILILASQRVKAFYCWDGVLSLFGGSDPNVSIDSLQVVNISRFKQIRTPDHVDFGVMDLQTLTALYKQVGSSHSSARGIDSLSKIFTEVPATSKKRGILPSPIELVILLWVISLIWAEIKQIRSLGVNYYKEDMWNILDSVASGFYVGTIILRVVSYIQSDESSLEVAREHWNAYDPTLLSEGLFAAATIFSALKIVYIFSVNPYLGPLQISLGRMIVDILRFSWIYMLVLFSFACGMNQLLWYYADLERHQCLNITNYSLAQYYSERFPTTLKAGNNQSAEEHGNMTTEDDLSTPPLTIDSSCKTWRHFSNVFESSQTLFWANFGLVDLENFDLTGIRQYTRFWALLMFGCYCFINVIVVLNLLIAMMNHSYVRISKKSDIEWKFARTRLWMSYFDTGSTVPAPFNVIPSIKSVFNLIRSAFCAAAAGKQQRKNCNLTISYRRVMRSIVSRYLIDEQRRLERKRELTEAKLKRWAKINAFEF